MLNLKYRSLYSPKMELNHLLNFCDVAIEEYKEINIEYKFDCADERSFINSDNENFKQAFYDTIMNYIIENCGSIDSFNIRKCSNECCILTDGNTNSIRKPVLNIVDDKLTKEKNYVFDLGNKINYFIKDQVHSISNGILTCKITLLIDKDISKKVVAVSKSRITEY